MMGAGARALARQLGRSALVVCDGIYMLPGPLRSAST